MPQNPGAGDAEKAGYFALSTTDHGDSPDEANRSPAPALPPRTSSSSPGRSTRSPTASPSRRSNTAFSLSNSPPHPPSSTTGSCAAVASAGPSKRNNITASGTGVGVAAGGRASGATMVEASSSPTRGREVWMGTDGVSGEGAGEEDVGADGLFHDAQDVPMPKLSVYDPERLWEYVERPLMVYMPLRKLVAKPPAVSTTTSIDELPVRCLVHRTLAGTEVETRLLDSSAERYRAAFAFVYMVSAETQEHYKQTVRPLIREWVEKVEGRGGGGIGDGNGGGGWLLLYVIVAPQAGGSSETAAAAAAAVEAQGKIFWWLCADFYSKTPGDRCSLVSLYVDGLPPGGVRTRHKGAVAARARPNASPRHHPKQWSDLLTKIGRVVMEVFESRVKRYVSELARIDASRGTPGWNFGDFFVVKESLALMYKELQLPSEALLKYQELAALILTMGEASEDDSRSPLVSPVHPKISGEGVLETERRRDSGARELLFGLGILGQPERQPASVLDYGRMRFRERVNGGRLRSLVLETQLYIFARQCALNLELKKPAEVARMGCRFMPAYYHELVGQAEDQRDEWGRDYDEASSGEEGSGPGVGADFSGALDPAEVELFALKSSWDVVKACDRYFARVMNPVGLELPPREMHAIRHARSETSRYLAELLEFAQARLMEYARLVAERLTGEGGDQRLAQSCVWELQERGFLSSQRDWVPEAGTASEGERLETPPVSLTLGRMRVDGGVIDVETLSSRYFWDRDEEGEVFIPPQEAGAKPFNPIKAITGGDGVPSPQRPPQSSNQIADFDDEEEDSDGPIELASAASKAAEAAKAAIAAAEGFSSSSAAYGGKTHVGSDGGRGAGTLLDGPRGLEDAYLQLTHSLAQHYQRAGRVRSAARWWSRRAELLLERGEVGVAQARLSALADLYQTEGWMPQAFWALHRLAQCRRTIALLSPSVGETYNPGSSSSSSSGDGYARYVSTVMRLAEVLRNPRVRSEGGRVAVDRAAGALLRDLSCRRSSAGAADVDAPEDASSDFPLRCFAEVRLLVVGLDGFRQRHSRAALRPDPLPYVHVGDVLRISCVLTSHLPVEVTLDFLSLEMAADGVSVGVGAGFSRASSGGVGSAAGGGGGTEGNRAGGMGRRAPMSRQKVLRRLESVGTLTGGDVGGPSPSGSPSPGSGGSSSVLSLPPPPSPAPSSLTPAKVIGVASVAVIVDDSGGGGRRMLTPGPGGAGKSVFQVPPIKTARSQSLSPRTSALTAPAPTPVESTFTRVSSGNIPARASSSHGGSRRPGSSRSPMRHSTGRSPGYSPGSSPSTSPSRLPAVGGASRPQRGGVRGRSRVSCSTVFEGPIRLSPGDNEVIFELRPSRPGIITASKVSATWAGVTLMEAFSGGIRRGASSFPSPGERDSTKRLPRPPSVVVRPFRPRAELEVIPPPFLPLGREGWVRVAVSTGPDALRDARLTVTAGRGLSWGDCESARVSLFDVTGGGEGQNFSESASAAAATVVDEKPAHARRGDDPSEIMVDVCSGVGQEEAIRPGVRVVVSLRVRASVMESGGGGGVTRAASSRRGSTAVPPSCTVAAELQAWHSRGSAGNYITSSSRVPASKTSAVGEPEVGDGWGVECRTRATASVVARLPFKAKVTVVPRPGGIVLAQAALVCSAPVALALRSCDAVDLEEGATLVSDPNAFLGGEVLPPGQPLRLAACVQRKRERWEGELKEGVVRFRPLPGVTVVEDGNPMDASLVVLRMRYAVIDGVTSSHEEEVFEFDVGIPSPGGDPNGAIVGTGPGEFGIDHIHSLTTFAKPCGGGSGVDESVDGRDLEGGAELLKIALAEPKAFEFGVEGRAGIVGSGGGGRSGEVEVTAQRVAYEIVSSPSEWMISGLVKGSAELHLKDDEQVFCRVHLVPIRGGLLSLPRLEVTTVPGPGEQQEQQERGLVVWAPEERKVLVLPPGETASVCKALAP